MGTFGRPHGAPTTWAAGADRRRAAWQAQQVRDEVWAKEREKKKAKEHKEKPTLSSEATSSQAVTRATYEKAMKAEKLQSLPSPQKEQRLLN